MRRFGCSAVLVAAAIALAWATSALAAQDDEFYRGLEQRGLKTLMEAYLKQQGEAMSGQPGAKAGPPGFREMKLAELAIKQAQQAQNMAAQDQAYQQAREFYEKAIEARKQAVAAVPADKLTDQNDARHELIVARIALANMIFQQWIKTDLNLLELTQRYGGNRKRAAELLGLATEAYAATIEDCEAWLTNLAMLPGDDYSRFTNLGKRRQIMDASKQATYFNAWAQYYYGWLLPEDYKPPKGKRNRTEVLNDAITGFMPFADDTRDRVANKWYARLGIGMCYRELGQTKKAMQQLALVTPPPMKPGAPPSESWKRDARIRTAYEKAITQLRMGQFAEGRKTVEGVRKKFKDAVDQSLYGQALPIVEASSLIQEGQKNNQQGLKDKGVAILKSLHKRDNPWPMVIQWVMKGMVGETPVGDLAPFQLWIRANDLMAEAQETKDAAKMKEAAGLFNAYAEKVGPEDPKYPTALYTQAAALLQVGAKSQAADLFRQVADKFPKYKYAPASAGYAVGVRGQVYEKAKTDANRQAYEDALHWFVQKWLQSDPDQQYFYALVLYRGEKYLEAADAFAHVPDKAEHYPDSRYWVALCRLEHFRNKVLASKDKQLILSGARDVAKRLVEFAGYAFKVQNADLPEQKRATLLSWAQFAYINAADVYLYNEVSLPADALPLLEETEKRFDLSKDARGRVLKLKIDSFQKLGRLDDANRVLEEFLAVADPKDVGPVLRGLFAAMTEDVRELIKRKQTKLAGTKVEQAKTLGDRFQQWLNASNLPQKEVEIENSRYDLAELYLAVNNFEQALQIYQEIAGPRPEKAIEEGKPLPEDAIYGMARAYEGLGDKATDPEQGKPSYERSLELWRVLRDVETMQPEDRWQRDYHLFYCKYRLGEKDEVAKNLKDMQIMSDDPLGGADPILQRKFRELEAAVSG